MLLLDDKYIYKMQPDEQLTAQEKPVLQSLNQDYQLKVKALTLLHNDILNKMNKLDNLNIQFKEKQQKSFLKTFVNIMDRMSNQMATYKEQYRNIDMQISQDQQCLSLANQLSFYQNECLVLRKQLEDVNNQINNYQNQNILLRSKRELLHSNLLQKSKKSHKYASKAYSLQKSFRDETQEDNAPFFTQVKRPVSINTNEKYRTVSVNSGFKHLRLQSPVNVRHSFNIKPNTRINSSNSKNRTAYIATSQGKRKRQLHFD